MGYLLFFLRLLLLSFLFALFLPVPSAADTEWHRPLERPLRVLRHFDPPDRPWLPGHRGVDLAAEPGQEVLAPGPGRVRFSGTVAGIPVVSLSHGDLRTTYLPVAGPLARGEPVSAGQVIGTVASAPRHCPHRTCLHWGLIRDGGYLDPLSLLSPPPVRLLPRFP